MFGAFNFPYQSAHEFHYNYFKIWQSKPEVENHSIKTILDI